MQPFLSLNVLVALPFNIYNNSLISRPHNWKLKPQIQKTNCSVKMRQALKTGKYNCLILDEAMQGIHVLSLIELVKEFPSVRILLISAVTAPHYLHELKKTGIAGLIFKQGKSDSIRHALAAIAENKEFYMCPMYLDMAFNHTIKSSVEILTGAEKEIFRYKLLGYSPSEIANLTNRTVNCVNEHIKRIIKKTGSTNLAHQLRYGFNSNIISHAEFLSNSF